MKIHQKLILFATCFLCFQSSAFSQLEVVTSRPNALYHTGEQIAFEVSSNISGTVSYVLKRDDKANYKNEGNINVIAGIKSTIYFPSKEAGVILCAVTMGDENAVAAAAVSPYHIKSILKEPADFDAFWTAKKAELAEVPIDPQVSFFSNTANSTTYRINLANINNRRIYGYITVPVGEGPFPAVVTLPPFGSGANTANPEETLTELSGCINMAISIHNAEPDQVDSSAYVPDIYNNRDSLYYKNSILGAIRAIDYLFTRADFDGENLCMAGISQGAGLAIITAGLDERVNLLLCSNPALSEHSGMKFDKATGFPYYILNSRGGFNTEQHENEAVLATQYYDAIHFAKRYDGPAMMIISYEDVVTPAATSFAAFNELSGMKLLVHAIELGHNQPNEYWSGRINMIRRYYEAALNPPIPNNNLSQGYFADAGADQTLGAGLSANLTGYVEDNGTPLDVPVEWYVADGPGKVVFSAPNFLETTANFNGPGVYKLVLRADDDVSLTSDNLRFSVFDEVRITVVP